MVYYCTSTQNLKRKEETMNLYLVSQDSNTSYDTYTNLVVAARNGSEARNTKVERPFTTWVTPDKVKVALLGTAIRGTKPGVILDHYHSG